MLRAWYDYLVGFGPIFSSFYSFSFSLAVDVKLFVIYLSVSCVLEGGREFCRFFLSNKNFLSVWWLGESIEDTWYIVDIGRQLNTSMCSVFHRLGPKFGELNGMW